MVNFDKKFPGLKGMLIVSLAVFILTIVGSGVFFAEYRTPILGLAEMEPAAGLFVALALMAILAVTVFGVLAALAAIWVIYGIFLLVWYFLNRSHTKGEAVDNVVDETRPSGHTTSS